MSDGWARRDINPARIADPQVSLAQRYIIGWPDGVVKIGLTYYGKRRWGIFVGKGGTLLDLAHYKSKGDALTAELWLQDQVELTYPRAFGAKSESVRHVGKAGGWTECYRIPASEWPALVELAGS